MNLACYMWGIQAYPASNIANIAATQAHLLPSVNFSHGKQKIASDLLVAGIPTPVKKN